MPKRTRARKTQRRTRRKNVGRAYFMNRQSIYRENEVLPCPMSSTLNIFAWAYNKITPSKAASTRPVSISSIALQLPPVTAPCTFQLSMVDVATNTLTPVDEGIELSLVNPTFYSYRVDNKKFWREHLPASTQVAFSFAFRFAANQTFTSLVPITTVFIEQPNAISVAPA
jgi:hypothetical protein